MKTIALFVILICLGFHSHAQTQNITIYCQVYPNIGGLKIEYDDLGKFLPDSIKTLVLIDYKKEYNLRNSDIKNAILIMAANGWKIASTLTSQNSNIVYYILGKEISMDEPTREAYLEKIKNR